MRRRVQFVAVLVIALLALQPILAGVPCAFGMSETCAAGCPMAMNGMGPDCPMTGRMTTADCPSDCCTHTLPQAAMFPATPGRVKLAVPAHSAVLPEIVFTPGQAPAPQAQIEARIASPPRYILNQVFRI